MSSEGKFSELIGFACASGAAVAFGVQYVPVKKYAIFDGTTFQWFMCSGILMVGFCVALATGHLKDGCPLMVVFGGALWGLSNYLVLPLVKLLGIGLGFSMYHFVNLIVGYCVGRFGLFSIPRLLPRYEGGLWYCDVGCLLVCVSFVALVFVEKEEEVNESPSETPPEVLDFVDAAASRSIQSETRDPFSLLPPPILSSIDNNYRMQYHRWRMGEAHGSKDPIIGLEDIGGHVPSMMMVGNQSAYVSVGGFSTYSIPGIRSRSSSKEQNAQSTSIPVILDQPRLGTTITEQNSPVASRQRRLLDVDGVAEYSETGWISSASLRAKRITGVLLAIVAGGFCGLQSVPAAVHNNAHPDTPPFAVVFPQFLGIWASSSAIYVFYAIFAKLNRWAVPHSAIRPAYSSGCIWAVGWILMTCGIRRLGYGVGYTLDAVGPIFISSLLSIFVFKEIQDRTQLLVFALAELLQFAGVLLISVFGQQG